MPPQRSFSSRGRSEFLSQYVNSNNNSSHNNSSSSSNSSSSNSSSNNNNSSSNNNNNSSSSNNNNNISSSNNNNSSSSSSSSSSNSDNSSRNSSNSNNNNRDNDNNNNDGTFFTRVSGWASSISASSMVRYLILIFLVGLVSVLYFATTHQVLKPSGTGPSITTEEYLIYPNSSSDLDNFPSGTDLPQQEYDKDKVIHINADYYLSKDYMRGELYDRGDGCTRYNPFDNPTNVTPPNAINAIPLPQQIKSYKIGLITYTGNSCSIEDRVQNSQDDNDTGVIIIKDMGSFSTVNISKNTLIPIFSIESGEIAIGIKQELRNLLASYSARNKTDDPYKVLRVTLKPYQPLFVNSWLFAMFAVGGILVASFFVSILIHMRLYRMRRNQQEELRRQREADDTLGMKKWTLEKDVVNSFRVIIYKKKKKNNNDSSDGDDGHDRNADNDNGNNDSSVVDNNGNNDDDGGDGNDKNNNDNSNDKDNNNSTVTGSAALIHRTSSMKSTKSTRSVRSTRSINAISNATDLYNSNDNNNKKRQSKRGSVTSIKEPSSSIDKVVVVKIDNDDDHVVDDEEGCSSNSNVDANANSNDQSMSKENRERLSNDDGNHDNDDDENDDDLNCAICLEDFDNGDEIRELPCKHWFHVECIDPWLINKSSSCPLCKKDCRPNSVDVVVSSEDELGGENDHNPSSRRTQNDNDDTNDNHNETSGSNSDTASNNNNNGNGTNLFGKIERLLGSKVRNRTTEEGHTNNGNNNSEDLELRSITRIL